MSTIKKKNVPAAAAAPQRIRGILRVLHPSHDPRPPAHARQQNPVKPLQGRPHPVLVGSRGRNLRASTGRRGGGGEGGVPSSGGGAVGDGGGDVGDDVPGGRLPATSDLVITTKMGSWDRRREGRGRERRGGEGRGTEGSKERRGGGRERSRRRGGGGRGTRKREKRRTMPRPTM